MTDHHQHLALVVRSGPYHCALPLDHVAETMRPLPVESLANMPAFVSGASVVRGQPMPVVDLARLLGDVESDARRFVVIHAGQRRVALAVDDVVGVRPIEKARLEAVPPLLRQAHPELVAALGSADEQLLLVLQAARILPDEVWQAIGRAHADHP